MSNLLNKELNGGNIDILLSILINKCGFSRERSEAVVHALVDIEESVDHIYNQLLPELLLRKENDQSAVKEPLWDMREQFRHIIYHINDAKLDEL